MGRKLEYLYWGDKAISISDKYEIGNLIKIVDEEYALGDEDTTMIFGTIEQKTFKINQMKLILIINTVEFD